MADGKAPELSHVQRAVRVVANDAAAHDEDAGGLSRIDQMAKVGVLGGLALCHAHTQHSPHVSGHRSHRGVRCKACHKGQGLGALVVQVIQIPGLPL